MGAFNVPRGRAYDLSRGHVLLAAFLCELTLKRFSYAKDNVNTTNSSMINLAQLCPIRSPQLRPLLTIVTASDKCLTGLLTTSLPTGNTSVAFPPGVLISTLFIHTLKIWRNYSLFFLWLTRALGRPKEATNKDTEEEPNLRSPPWRQGTEQHRKQIHMASSSQTLEFPWQLGSRLSHDMWASNAKDSELVPKKKAKKFLSYPLRYDIKGNKAFPGY